MIDSILFGAGIIALLAVWRRVLTPSLVDHYRDVLFDIRDEARERFLNSQIGLTDRSYAKLREQLNAHILFIEKVSLFRLVYLIVWTTENNSTARAASRFASTIVQVEDSELQSFIDSARIRAAQAVLEYATTTSLSFWLISLVFLPFFLAADAARGLAKGGTSLLRLTPGMELVHVLRAGLAILGLQGKSKPAVETILERAATENGRALGIAALS